MKTLLRILVFIFAALFTSCADKEATFDGSSDKSAEESFEKMASSLDEAKKEELTSAYAKIALSHVLKDMVNSGDGDSKMVKDFLNKIDGMTADEIIDYSKTIQ